MISNCSGRHFLLHKAEEMALLFFFRFCYRIGGNKGGRINHGNGFSNLGGPTDFSTQGRGGQPADVEAMHRCYQCPEVHRYTQGRAFRLEEWPEIIRGWEMERQKGGFIRWGIALTGDGALIGGIYLYRNDGKVFLGYLLHPAYWGNGYAFEAVNLVKRYAFTEWNIKHCTPL